MNTSTNPHAGYRYPSAIISHAVWMEIRSLLSLWHAKTLLAAWGIVVTYEIVRQLCLKEGQHFGTSIRRQWPAVRVGTRYPDLVAKYGLQSWCPSCSPISLAN